LSPDPLSKARTSAILSALAARPHERLTVADIIGVLRDRAFALLVVLLGLPNCLPDAAADPAALRSAASPSWRCRSSPGFRLPWLPQGAARRSVGQDRRGARGESGPFRSSAARSDSRARG
jgi:hypothetical protein